LIRVVNLLVDRGFVKSRDDRPCRRRNAVSIKKRLWRKVQCHMFDLSNAGAEAALIAVKKIVLSMDYRSSRRMLGVAHAAP